MNFEISDTQQALIENVRGLLSDFGPEYWRERDRTKTFPHEFEKHCAQAGLFGTMLPDAYGGIGLGVTEAALILREISGSAAGLDGCSVVHMGLFGLNPLLIHGTEQQRAEFLPRAAAGDLHTCFMVTEPDAGTDTSRITTYARRDGDDYVINGRKVWISRGQEAEYGLLLCRTTRYDEVDKGTDGMSLLFIPLDSDAITMTEIPKMGRHAVDSNEVVIDDYRVPASTLIGEEGRGFQQLLDGLNPERIMIAAEAIGLGLHTVELAAKYAGERVVFGRPIGMNQGVQLPLADAYSQLKVAWLQTLEAAWRYDNGLPCGVEANLAKLRGTEAAHVAVNIAFETFGGYGYAQEFDIERFYRQLPLTRVAPVTNILTRAYVAERVLGLPKSY